MFRVREAAADSAGQALRGVWGGKMTLEADFRSLLAEATSSVEDDEAYSAGLADQGILVLPGSVVEVPGWFRLSLTASDEMVERAIPRFAAALDASG